MNRPLSIAAFALGLAAIGWVTAGFIGHSPLALVMTLLIGAAYLVGALELHRFQRATQTLHSALANLPDTPPRLADWLDSLHPSLHSAVRQRVEGERSALPGPALTPYLVGLLVLLGMLGTFLGMVVTLNGAVMALETTTDLPTIRAALAAPVKGLGLAFGTSVAGVAASAMLGLMSALCRRDRLNAAAALDTQIATRLHRYTRAHQRQQMLDTLQTQAAQMPELLAQVQGLMAQMQRQGEALNERLLAGQDRFHQHAQTSYTELAASVDRSLQHSLNASAQQAAATLQPLVEQTVAGMARETTSFQQHVAQTLQQTLAAWTAQFEARSTELLQTLAQAQARQQADAGALDQQRLQAWTQTLTDTGRELQAQAAAQTRSQVAEISALLDAATQAPRAAATLVAELREQLSSSLVRDTALLEERQRIMAALGGLLDTLAQASTEQRTAVATLLSTAASTLQQTSQQFGERMDAEAARSAHAAAQVSASAVEVASLGEAFGTAVQMFTASSEALAAQLQRIEAALGKSTARSDEQLAYYVAQAREIIDLSISSQQQIVEDLRQLALRPAPLSGEVA